MIDRRIISVTLLAGFAVLAASCGSSHAKSTTTTLIPQSTSTTGSTSTTSSTTSSTSATGGQGTRCLASALGALEYGSEGGAGTLLVTVQLTNRSTATCTLEGYPGAQLFTASDSAMATNVVRGSDPPVVAGNSYTTMAPALVTMAPGTSAYVNIIYSGVPTGNEGTCAASSLLGITPPGDTGSLTISAALSACDGGTLVVSPVFAATGANTATTAPQAG